MGGVLEQRGLADHRGDRSGGVEANGGVTGMAGAPVTVSSTLALPRCPMHSRVSFGSLVTKASGCTTAIGSASAPPSICSSQTLATTTTRERSAGAAAATPHTAAAIEAFWSQIPKP